MTVLSPGIPKPHAQTMKPTKHPVEEPEVVDMAVAMVEVDVLAAEAAVKVVEVEEAQKEYHLWCGLN